MGDISGGQDVQEFKDETMEAQRVNAQMGYPSTEYPSRVSETTRNVD